MKSKKRKYIRPAAVFIMAVFVLISFGGCGKKKGKATIPQMEEILLPEKKTGVDWKEVQESKLSTYTYSVAENNNFSLCIKDNGEVAVWDKKSEFIYATNPIDMEEDQIAQAINKMNLGSQAYIEFIDQNGATRIENTLAGAVNKENISYEPISNGVKFWYYFEDYKVLISLNYILEEDGLRVQFPLDDIKENIDYGFTAEDRNTVPYWGIMNVTMLPYFGAAGLEDEGYMLIPDGSGALIYHNNNKASYDSYKQEVYSREPALHMEKNTQVGETVRMPVFGNKIGNHGVFGVITSGEASASIQAMTSGVLTSYNTVYPKFTYRQSSTALTPVSNSYGDEGILGANVISSVLTSEKEFEVKYYLLEKEDLDYVDFAECYRNYLVEEYGLTKNTNQPTSPLFLNLYGGLKLEKYVLGLKTHPVEKLTTYSQAKTILEELIEADVYGIALKYTGWQKDGIESKVQTKPHFEKKLGGYKEYKELVQYADQNSILFFPDFDLINFYKGRRGYSLFNDSAQLIQQTPAYQYSYVLHTLAKDEDIKWRLLTPKKVQDLYESIGNNYENMLTDKISLSTLGNTLYSDFSTKSNGIQRGDTMAVWSEILDDANKEFNQVMVDGGNAYSAVAATHVFGAPNTSTHYDMADESIPFYQIVFHGYLSYSTSPINLSGDPTKEMLKALETGSSLGYSLMYGDSLNLIETKYNFLYSADYRVWLPTIINQYKEVAPVLEQIQGKAITGHKMIIEDVYKTVFEDGSIVYVNYGKEAALVEGHEIDGKNFAFIASRK